MTEEQFHALELWVLAVASVHSAPMYFRQDAMANLERRREEARALLVPPSLPASTIRMSARQEGRSDGE